MLTDAQRKTLTEYIGECWHGWTDGLWQLGKDGYGCLCNHCKRVVYRRNGEEWLTNRTFTTDSDLSTVYSAMVRKGEWEEFDSFIYLKWRLITPEEGPFAGGKFTAWLFCLNAPDQIPERMKMAAEWIEGRKG